METTKKKIKELPIITTTHGVGQKRVLLNSQETSTPLTQIAITRLKAGEAAEHLHPTMEEFFLFQKGDAIMTVGKKQIMCNSGDFITIPANTLHSLKAITDIEIITIGCAIH